MATRKTARTQSKTAQKRLSQALPHHRIDALLHTMRCIAQHEDALCELSHSIKTAKTLSPAAKKELRTILDKLPLHDYVHDLDAVQSLLPSQAS